MNTTTELRHEISGLSLAGQLNQIVQTLQFACSEGDWAEVKKAHEVLGDIRMREFITEMNVFIQQEQWRQGELPRDVNQEAG